LLKERRILLREAAIRDAVTEEEFLEEFF